MQNKLINEELPSKPNLSRGYSTGSYNKIIDGVQHIRISEGCPNDCWYCGETKINGTKPIYLEIPKITKNKVMIYDMNLIYKPKALEIIKKLGSKKVNNKVIYYELWCGIDYRYLTQEVADALKKNRFVSPRIAWDHKITDQFKVIDTKDMLINAGYKSNDIMCFILANGKINLLECLKKFLVLFYHHLQVDPCYFDNQVGRDIKPMYWEKWKLSLFAFITRKANQIIRRNGFDPETHKNGS